MLTRAGGRDGSGRAPLSSGGGTATHSTDQGRASSRSSGIVRAAPIADAVRAVVELRERPLDVGELRGRARPAWPTVSIRSIASLVPSPTRLPNPIVAAGSRVTVVRSPSSAAQLVALGLERGTHGVQVDRHGQRLSRRGRGRRPTASDEAALASARRTSGEATPRRCSSSL